MLRAVRGATTVDANTEAALHAAVAELLHQLVDQNRIEPEAISIVFFTVTADLTAMSAAKVARLTQPWQHVPLMCALEPAVDGLPQRCVRVLIQFETSRSQRDLVPVYLKGAAVLRPDLCPG